VDFRTLNEEYDRLFEELELAVQAEDEEKTREVDTLIVANFAKILEYSPMNKSEREEQLRFLLQRLCPVAERDRVSSGICEKIISLADMDF
jgi:hypothetical protein